MHMADPAPGARPRAGRRTPCSDAPAGRKRAPIRGGIAVVILLAAACVAGCGSDEGAASAKPPNYAEALAGAPAPLARLYDDADQLLPGGVDAFRRRLAELRGHPVVVSKWASWCGPCRTEFPWYQRLSAKLGKRIAFIGVNSNDSSAAARTFLGEFPVPYPSYVDPGEEIARLIGATVGFPGTAFYDRAGALAYTRQGQYPSESALAADVRRYAR
jgi:cytochrome c biogenesis protein CcmG/thiol:disulfide interchange protein DsbE